MIRKILEDLVATKINETSWDSQPYQVVQMNK
jgi:hypothetical protein